MPSGAVIMITRSHSARGGASRLTVSVPDSAVSRLDRELRRLTPVLPDAG